MAEINENIVAQPKTAPLVALMVGEGRLDDAAERDNEAQHKKQVSVIYGLDADLIMLCLNHLRISKQLYLYRETPEFIKTIDKSLKPNENYFLNIQELSNEIIRDMDADGLTVTGQNSQLIQSIHFSHSTHSVFLILICGSS